MELNYCISAFIKSADYSIIPKHLIVVAAP